MRANKPYSPCALPHPGAVQQSSTDLGQTRVVWGQESTWEGTQGGGLGDFSEMHIQVQEGIWREGSTSTHLP